MKVQELLKVPSPENRLMLLQLGMNETARSLVVEALSHAENYPLILKCLSAPVAVEKELVDPMFYVTALDDPCIFKSAWDTDITLEDNVPLTSLLVGTDGMERAEKVRDDIISIVASNGADAVESRLAYISDDLYARQENILLMRDKERLDSLLSQ